MINAEIKAPIDKNKPTGYTKSNLFNSLSKCKDLMPIALVVGNPIKLSPSIKKIPKGTIAKLNAKKKISIRNFLFSILGIFLRKRAIIRNAPITIHAKWNLYPYGDNAVKNPIIPEGKLPFSKKNVVMAPNAYIAMMRNGSR